MTWYMPSNVSTLHDMMVYANSITNNSFWIVIVLIVFTIAYTVMSVFGNEKALPVSFYITSIITALLFMGGLVNETWMFMAIIGAAGSTLWVIAKR